MSGEYYRHRDSVVQSSKLQLYSTLQQLECETKDIKIQNILLICERFFFEISGKRMFFAHLIFNDYLFNNKMLKAINDQVLMLKKFKISLVELLKPSYIEFGYY